MISGTDAARNAPPSTVASQLLRWSSEAGTEPSRARHERHTGERREPMNHDAAHRNETADLSTPKAAASNRVTVPSPHPEYNISVATEQTSPGVWKAVATVTHA